MNIFSIVVVVVDVDRVSKISSQRIILLLLLKINRKKREQEHDDDERNKWSVVCVCVFGVWLCIQLVNIQVCPALNYYFFFCLDLNFFSKASLCFVIVVLIVFGYVWLVYMYNTIIIFFFVCLSRKILNNHRSSSFHRLFRKIDIQKTNEM